MVKAIRAVAGKVLNGQGQTARNVGVGAALVTLTGYLATEVYGNLKAADVRLESSIVSAVVLLRDEAKERRELDEKRWDKQNEVNDAMVRALESIRMAADRKP